MRRRSGTLERLCRPLFGILKQTHILFIYLFFFFLRNYFLRELGDAEFILRELGGAEFILWENWVARDLFLRKLGIAELIFARTGWRGICFCESWVSRNLFLRIGCQPHENTELLSGYFRIKGTIFDRKFECQWGVSILYQAQC